MARREDAKRGVYVDKLSEWVVRNERELLELMARGAKNRVTGATKMNDVSSRAHAVFMIIVERSMGHGSNDVSDLQKSVAASRQMGLAAAMPEMPHSIRVCPVFFNWCISVAFSVVLPVWASCGRTYSSRLAN